MASSTLFPTQTQDSAISGTLTWANPNNIQATDGTSATTTMSGTAITHALDCQIFGFAIPAGATIDGIEVTVRKQRTGGSANQIQDSRLQLAKAGVLTGSDKADTATSWPSVSLTDFVYGSSSDLWGTTWTPSEINASNFGLIFQAKGNGSSDRIANVDSIKVTVYYTPAVAGGVIANVSSMGNISSLTF